MSARPNGIPSVSLVDDPVLAEALTIVMAGGYVPLKAKSYRQAQERQHIAQAEAEWEKESAAHARAWAHDCLEKERHLSNRCVYLYGLAAKLGATDDQLRGNDPDAQKTTYLDGLRLISKYNYSTGQWDPVDQEDPN